MSNKDFENDLDDKANWPKPIENYFISMLYEETKKGLQTNTLEKNQWDAIDMKLMPNYPIRKQRRIPIACCAVHNYIRMQSRNDTLFQQFEDNDVDVVDEECSGTNQEGKNMHLNDDNVMNDVRDHIAGSMWLDYANNN
ncbi:hypothetical protein C1H46_001713 [Malus baccata]|uniref:Myb/SANT-like domain-containing protein n=1 Tax=Malus baccata TaxID=106549 RepID=A0A540NQ07_MALBA|nr:hypothetical protein C1H46_001713 [Malus baccata]